MDDRKNSALKKVSIIIIILVVIFGLSWYFGLWWVFPRSENIPNEENSLLDNFENRSSLSDDTENLNLGENSILFKYEAEFTYLGSEENKPLQKYGILFPCPTVDNEPVWPEPNISSENLKWQLWGRTSEGNLVLEVDDDNTIRPVGDRKLNGFPNYDKMAGRPFLGPIYYSWLNTTWKINIQNDWDNLYPKETILVEGNFSVSIENSEKVTLREHYGSVFGAQSWINSFGPVDTSISVSLLKWENGKYEKSDEYSSSKNDSGKGDFVRLYPT